LKKQATRAGKAVHRVAYEAAPKVGKVVGYIAPVAGAVVGTLVGIGPTAGAAAGSVVGAGAAGATQHGSRKTKMRTAKRFGKYGAAMTAAAGATEVTGLVQGPLSLFGGAPAAQAEGATDWGQAFGTDIGTPSPSSTGDGWFSDLIGGGGKAAESLYERKLASARERVTENVSEGITAPFDINAPGGSGGGPGGAGSPGSTGKPIETQHLIIGGVVIAVAWFMLKGRK